MTLRVTSEVGKLSSVLVHLPGPEIDRMIPAMMGELLFDDILYGARAREEHRRFQQVLGFVTDEVLDAQTLLAQVLETHRDEVLEDLGRKLGWGPEMDYRLRELPAAALAATLVTGIEKPEDQDAVAAHDLYSLPPVPNWFFQRDPLVVVADRAIRCSMATPARQREPLLSGYIFQFHPRFRGTGGAVLVRRISVQLRAVSLVCADAADARGRRRPGAARGRPRDRVLGAHGEDDDRETDGDAQESEVADQADLRRRRCLPSAPSCTSTRSSR